MQEHPFARYIRPLGRGPGRARNLTGEEAQEAMRMILRGDVRGEQLGAFLMLMRYKRETAEELAGFTLALREILPTPSFGVDLDWSSYASGRSRGQPWFLLAALLLARNGLRVFLHGASPVADQHSLTEQGAAILGIRRCRKGEEADRAMAAENIAFMNLGDLCPPLHHLLCLRPVLGLRSPANALARLFNPMRAPAQFVGVFHPGFRSLQQQAAHILEQPAFAVLKGAGGEAERRPEKTCALHVSIGEEMREIALPPLIGKEQSGRQDHALSDLRALWNGDITDAHAEATVIATAAIGLLLCKRAATPHEADEMAATLWQTRHPLRQ